MSENSTYPYDNSLPFDCIQGFDNFLEVLKFVCQMVYLVPGWILHILILKTILYKESKVFLHNSFFVIYALDSFASLIMLSYDITFTRAAMYIPPLCPILSPYFYTPSIFLKLAYVIPNYMKAMKSVTQIFMNINRMHCIIFPMTYKATWNQTIYIILVFISLSPCLVTWNLMISRITVFPMFGGFGVSYIKRVTWASLSTFHFLFLSTAVVITIVCTVISVFVLTTLPMRVKNAEKTLCIANSLISVGFIFTAICQSIYAFCSGCSSDFLFGMLYLSYDFLNIVSPMIVICMSSQLRNAIFPARFFRHSTVSILPSGTSQNT